MPPAAKVKALEQLRSRPWTSQATLRSVEGLETINWTLNIGSTVVWGGVQAVTPGGERARVARRSCAARKNKVKKSRARSVRPFAPSVAQPGDDSGAGKKPDDPPRFHTMVYRHALGDQMVSELPAAPNSSPRLNGSKLQDE